jgi:hypothetical protein
MERSFPFSALGKGNGVPTSKKGKGTAFPSVPAPNGALAASQCYNVIAGLILSVESNQNVGSKLKLWSSNAEIVESTLIHAMIDE